MNIFKNYFKIVKAHKFSILLYTIIFSVMVMFNSQISTPSSGSFTAKKPTIAFYDHSDNQLSRGLKSYLNEISEIVEVNPQQAEDDLFISSIQGIVTVNPKYQLDSLVDYKSSPGATSDFLLQQKLNAYLKTVKIYHDAGFSIEESIAKTTTTLAKEAHTEIHPHSSGSGSMRQMAAFFNALNYVLMAQIIIILNLITQTFNEETVLKRNQVSSTPKLRQNLEIISGHIVVSLLIWSVYILINYFLFKDEIALASFGRYALNSLIFLLSALALAYLLTRIFRTPESAGGVANVVSLATSFFSGAFVPQSLLPAATLTIGRLFPSFYYISNNDELVSNPNMNLIYQNWLIMLGFTVAFLIVAILIKPKGIRKKT